MKPDQSDKPEKPGEKFSYFVDGEKFENGTESTTGAVIKSKLPESKRGYALYLEAHGNDPDLQIADTDTVSLEKEKGPKRFYTVPPANFG